MQQQKVQCPICGGDGFRWNTKSICNLDLADCRCDFCGSFSLPTGFFSSNPDEKERITFAYYYHRYLKREDATVFVKIDNNVIKRALAMELPTPNEQFNNLLLYIGDKTKEGIFGNHITLDWRTSLIIGITVHGFLFLLKQMELDGYGVLEKNLDMPEITITLKGYERYELLKKGISDSKKVFMAMNYGNTELDDMLEKVFKPAVGKTGFELYKLDEKPEAGIIDNRLRVEIRNAKFLIADLTHSNEGAYWEAGFAEGLGKKVILTCKKEAVPKPHFDLRNSLIVFWDKKSEQDCAEQLKATIRNTFPDEAKMED